MCFNTTRYAKIKIAKEDIECWKWMIKKKKTYISPYRDFIYKKGVVTSLVKLVKKVTAEAKASSVPILSSEFVISKGYHSYRSKEIAKDNTWYGADIHKFIIPKGTHYYANRDGEYVSEQIILVKEETNN